MMSSGSITPREARSWAWISAAVSGPIARWSWCGTKSRSWRSSRPSGTASSTRPGTGSSRSSSSCAEVGRHARAPGLLQGRDRPFVRLLPGQPWLRGGRGLLRRGQGGQALRQPPHRQRVRAQAPARSPSREPCALLLRRHLRVAGSRQELAEFRSPTMEIEEGQVKQVLEDKEALAARLHRSPDVLDALLMTFTSRTRGELRKARNPKEVLRAGPETSESQSVSG